MFFPVIPGPRYGGFSPISFRQSSSAPARIAAAHTAATAAQARTRRHTQPPGVNLGIAWLLVGDREQPDRQDQGILKRKYKQNRRNAKNTAPPPHRFRPFMRT